MKKMIFFLILSFLLLCSTKFAAITLEGINIYETTDGYIVDFELPDYEFQKEIVSGETYLKLMIQDYGATSIVGMPEFPIISFNLAVDEQEKPVIKNIDFLTEIINLDAKIYPAQRPWPKNRPLSERPFDINTEFYEGMGKTKFASFAVISNKFIVRGINGITIVINPISSYNPIENKLEIITKGTFKITVSKIKNLKDKIKKEPPPKSFDNFFKSLFRNYSTNGNLKSESLTESLPEYLNQSNVSQQTYAQRNYLIISDSAFVSNLSSFVSHKQSKGYNVDLVSTNITGTTSTAIKTYIQNKYNNTASRPEFILFVGNTLNIPAWVGYRAITDYDYACLEGNDHIADAFIGRFSVSNGTQLNNIISKTIYMENKLKDLPAKAIFMASRDHGTVTEGTHNFVISNYFGPYGFINKKHYCSNGATDLDVKNDLNDNQLAVVYSGHGAIDYWADGPVLYQWDVNSLTNNLIYPFVFSFACSTGFYYDYWNECFMETWIRAPKGAVASIGSSLPSSWTEDDILEKKIFQEAFLNEHEQIAPMLNRGKFELYNYYGGELVPIVVEYMEMYNIFGDPSLPMIVEKDILTVSPQTFNFGDIKINRSSLPLTLTLKNDGTTNLIVTGMTLSNTQNYTLTGNMTPTILPGKSSIVSIVFNPKSVGQLNTTLNISYKDWRNTNKIVSISLTGNGINPSISVFPTTCNFGNINIGGISSPIIVTISNGGTTNLQVTGMALSDVNNYMLTGNMTPTISPNGNSSVNLTFNPKTIGLHNATLIMSSNDSDNLNVSISLTGSGGISDTTITNKTFTGYETIITINSITAGPAVSIEPGADVKFRTGNVIYLKPGFWAKLNSKFRAYIGQ